MLFPFGKKNEQPQQRRVLTRDNESLERFFEIEASLEEGGTNLEKLREEIKNKPAEMQPLLFEFLNIHREHDAINKMIADEDVKKALRKDLDDKANELSAQLTPLKEKYKKANTPSTNSLSGSSSFNGTDIRDSLGGTIPDKDLSK